MCARPGDYIAQMIALAGGNLCLFRRGIGGSDAGAPAPAINMDPESVFYAAAKDADVLIYNSTVDGEISQRPGALLCQKARSMQDCKAVKERNRLVLTDVCRTCSVHGPAAPQR